MGPRLATLHTRTRLKYPHGKKSILGNFLALLMGLIGYLSIAMNGQTIKNNCTFTCW